MELLFNDLSIAGQFSDIHAFREAIKRMMEMREVARKFNRILYCHRNVASAKVTQHLNMQQAIQSFKRDEQRAVMQWLTKLGPFWNDDTLIRMHSPNAYLECNGNIVTDTAVGEAAYCSLHGVDRRLASLIPSEWEFSPVQVSWVPDASPAKNIAVINYWKASELEATLRDAPAPICSWDRLATIVRTRFTNLKFVNYTFQPLRGVPFSERIAQHICNRLYILDQLKGCFNEQGQRTSEGHRLYQDYFTGNNALFSDSSDTEKTNFERELTFPHPEIDGQTLFCPWHGKVKTRQIRIHFTWPAQANKPLYVVYVGSKITKQ